MKHFKRYWQTYLLAAACIFLLYLLLSGNKPVESHRTEYDSLNKAYTSLQDSIKAVNNRDAVQQRVIIQQDSTIRTIRASNEATRRQLDVSKANAKRLAAEVKAEQPEDTSAYAKKVNELIDENTNLIWLNDQYVAAVDSLNLIVDQQKVAYEQRITDQVNLNSQMRTLLDNGATAYTGLQKDYNKLSKKLGREKLKTKSAAVIAAAAIVYGFIKK
jgi:hypothetical protein